MNFDYDQAWCMLPLISWWYKQWLGRHWKRTIKNVNGDLGCKMKYASHSCSSRLCFCKKYNNLSTKNEDIQLKMIYTTALTDPCCIINKDELLEPMIHRLDLWSTLSHSKIREHKTITRSFLMVSILLVNDRNSQILSPIETSAAFRNCEEHLQPNALYLVSALHN